MDYAKDGNAIKIISYEKKYVKDNKNNEKALRFTKQQTIITTVI